MIYEFKVEVKDYVLVKQMKLLLDECFNGEWLRLQPFYGLLRTAGTNIFGLKFYKDFLRHLNGIRINDINEEMLDKIRVFCYGLIGFEPPQDLTLRREPKTKEERIYHESEFV